MIELIGILIEALLHLSVVWGILLGSLIAFLITLLLSYFLLGEFNLIIFGMLCIPFCILGGYMQYKKEFKK